jgi:hypothetical protein
MAYFQSKPFRRGEGRVLPRHLDTVGFTVALDAAATSGTTRSARP